MLNLIVVRKSIGMMPRVTVTVFCFESGGGSYEMVGDRGHVNEQALRQVDLALTTGDSGISITAGASAMENSLAEKVTRQVNDALQPLFSHATVNWGVWEDFLKYPTSPAVAQAVFSGDRRLFFAMLLPRLGDRRLPPTSIVTVEAHAVRFGSTAGFRGSSARCHGCNKERSAALRCAALSRTTGALRGCSKHHSGLGEPCRWKEESRGRGAGDEVSITVAKPYPLSLPEYPKFHHSIRHCAVDDGRCGVPTSPAALASHANGRRCWSWTLSTC